MKKRSLYTDAESGFSLIELLVVVIILGILAAIAIPVFLDQRRRGFDSRAASDLRNLIAIQLSLQAGDQPFSDVAATLEVEGWTPSDGSIVCVAVDTADPTALSMAAWHPEGGQVFGWSDGTQFVSAAAIPLPTSCGDPGTPTGSVQVS